MTESLKILTVVGARPQFIKAAMVSRAVRRSNERAGSVRIIEEILHTGQHYDDNMSRTFFEELDIPEPAIHLGIRGNGPGDAVGRMLMGIETEIVARRPDGVLVYGDTHSTLAGALAAAQRHVPVAHVEAGLRSFNRRMPEETNRILADHVSALLFCPTRAAVANLANEGIVQGVHHVGDVMYDAALAFGGLAGRRSTILRDLGLEPKGYYLATVHRAENADDSGRLGGILAALRELAGDRTVVFPLHPRTRARLGNGEEKKPPSSSGLRMIDPVSYLDMVQLERNARIILTDSGGVQKEAYFHGVPCITLREETEWVETLEAGWNRLAGSDAGRILAAVREAGAGRPIPDYGRGESAEAIVARLEALARPMPTFRREA